MLVIVLVILVVWVYEARKNLEAFRAGPFKYSPGMAVGAFFIPIVNYWWPCLVVQEIWKGSDPELPPFWPQPFATRRGSPLVTFWWVAFLVNNLFAMIVYEILKFTRGDLSISYLRVTAELLIVSRVLRIVSVALTATLTYYVLRRQTALARRMERPTVAHLAPPLARPFSPPPTVPLPPSGTFAPPPPPTWS